MLLLLLSYVLTFLTIKVKTKQSKVIHMSLNSSFRDYDGENLISLMLYFKKGIVILKETAPWVPWNTSPHKRSFSGSDSVLFVYLLTAVHRNSPSNQNNFDISMF